jgi:hypothetical protein
MEREHSFFEDNGASYSFGTPEGSGDNLGEQLEAIPNDEVLGAKQEEIRRSTRERLMNFLSGVCKGAKLGLEVVPGAQQLVQNLGIGSDLAQSPAKCLLVQVLDIAGGVRSFSAEKGIIKYDEDGNNKLRGVISDVNNFLAENKGLKLWLQGVINRASTQK